MGYFTLLVLLSVLGTFVISDSSHISSADHDLPWPLPSSWIIDTVMVHALHCVDMMKSSTNTPTKEDMDVMHKEHCSEVVNRFATFFADNPDFDVPEFLCEDFRKMLLGPRASEDKNGKKNQTIQSLGSANGYGYDNYKENTLFDKVSATDFSYDKYEHEPSGSSSGRTPTLSLRKQHSRKMSRNYGKLLMKKWHRQPLNAEEKQFFADWERAEVIRVSAVALRCMASLGSNPEAALRGILTS